MKGFALVLLSVAVLQTGAAHAAVITPRNEAITEYGDKGGASTYHVRAFDYVAEPGEANRLEIGFEDGGHRIVFRDPGAAIRFPSDCERRADESVACTPPATCGPAGEPCLGTVGAAVCTLGDGDDRGTVRNPTPTSFPTSRTTTASLDGGPGSDQLDGPSTAGGDGDDVLTGSTANGGAGNDVITTTYSGDGGEGDDQISVPLELAPSSFGIRTLKGGPGRDTLHGGSGNDFLNGGPGADQVDGAEGEDTAVFEDESAPVIADLAGGQATTSGDTDRLASIEDITGGSGNDTLRGDPTVNKISGGPGGDTVEGGDGADVLDGGDGDDSLSGAAGDDRIDGAAGDDELDGGPGNDTLEGGDGRSRMRGGEGNDSLFMFGPSAPKPGSRLSGGPGRDALWVSGAGAHYDCGAGSSDSLIFGQPGFLPKTFVSSAACERVEAESSEFDRYGWCSFSIAPVRLTSRGATYRLYRDLTPPWQGSPKAKCLGRLYLSTRLGGRTVDLGAAKPSSSRSRVTVHFPAKARAQLGRRRDVVLLARFRPSGTDGGQARWQSKPR